MSFRADRPLRAGSAFLLTLAFFVGCGTPASSTPPIIAADASDLGGITLLDTGPPPDRGPRDVNTCDATLCDAGCVDLQTDPENCGMCGRACPMAGPNTRMTCAQGVCNMPLVCAQGFADCDGMVTNGCEVNLAASAENCGRCGMVCPAAPNGVAACQEGMGATTCAMGFGNCDMNAANGCETDTRRSAMNCGACGRLCSIGGDAMNATPACVDGACSVTCAEGFGNCDGSVTNGCETNLQSSMMHCGACGMACQGANATGACMAGRCMLTCNAGFADCDGMAANGCEVDLNASTMHCGRCGMACPTVMNAMPTCTRGTCGYACQPGFGECNSVRADGCEINLLTSTENCGRCENVCPGYSNATPACLEGTCRPACAMGFGNCDANADNGCETDIRRSATHCGACGRACPIAMDVANAMPGCVDGACSIVCNAGFGNCDGNVTNGCETNLQSSTTHCGACGMACQGANATGACMAGRCVLTCSAGFADCDGMAANGCEVELNTSTAHCGRCGMTCPTAMNAMPTCTRGACGSVCLAGYEECNGVRADGCEVNLLTAAENCGRCSNVCPGYANATSSCEAGVCRPACAMGFGNCDANVANGCETDVRVNPSHCGVCGRVCPAGANAQTVCTAGVCGLNCNTGFGDCDVNAANGCEANLSTSTTHCGACGRACVPPNATGVCAVGQCAVGTCNAGFNNCDGDAVNGCETMGPCVPRDGGADVPVPT
jgi:hypothetical protein